MKKTVLLALSAAFLSSSAFAADLAPRYTKAPAPVVSPATNWSGFYVGAMGGYGWSSQISASIPGVGGGTINSNELSGGFGGGTIGYNWQAPGSQFVWGLEVDAAGGSIGESATGFGVTVSERINALGSVTGRIGLAANSALFYIKGGYAWANNQISATNGIVSFSESRVHSGWTVGGGVEWMFAPAWSLKGEYMYADFSKANYLGNLLPPGVDIGASFHTVKLGVNYHFN